MYKFIILMIISLLYSVATITNAAFIPANVVPDDRNVIDRGPVGSFVTIQWTDVNGDTIMIRNDDGILVPAGGQGTIDASGEIRFRAPQTIGSVYVYDFTQSITPPGPGGGVPGRTSVLDVRAFEKSGSDFLVTPFSLFDFTVPDVFTNTNGGTLYSAVNLIDFLANPPVFNIGDNFNIINGVSAALPGMLFGTQKITADASSPNGWSNIAPYTGVGTVEAEHTVPEPSIFFLMLAGFVTLQLSHRVFRSRAV